MPSTLTHAYFVMDGMKLFEQNVQNFLKDSTGILKITAQSTDPFMFYNLLKPWKKRTIANSFASKFHTTKTGEFLTKFTEYVKANDYVYNSNIMALLYGFISHYILDSTIHPYVYYKTGAFKSHDKTTYKYNSGHHIMEAYIDNYLVKKREKIKPYKYKCYKLFDGIKEFNKETNEVLDVVFKEIYNYDNFSKDYIQSLKDMRFVFRYVKYDPHGSHEKILCVIDLLKPKSVLKHRFMSYHYSPKNSEHYLNENKKKWNYAANDKLIKNLSFEELYKEALNKYIKVIKEINKYLYEDINIDLLKTYGNLSYGTGLEWQLKKENKYFEF